MSEGVLLDYNVTFPSGIETSGVETSCYLSMGEVQKKVHNLLTTEWFQLVKENPSMFKEGLVNKKPRTCLDESKFPEFKTALRALKQRKKKLQAIAKTPEEEARKHRVREDRRLERISRRPTAVR